ncbi:Hypothetical_protein [Hexamita inflata]|uniref:Hypothetical_protein n=1 Tax=Hexamita inflata TaxID=28002 RepID=A0AA86NW26_9EUKA|nr:Hypothetical protein HINF_LOCUS14683 [Hexamita inflata]
MTSWLTKRYFIEFKEISSGKEIFMCKKYSTIFYNKSKCNFMQHLKSKHEATDFDKEYQNYIQSATFSSVSAITPIQNSDSVMLTVTPTQPVKRMLHSEEELLKIEEILRFFAVCDLSFEKVKIPFVQHFLGKIRGPDLGPLCTTTLKRHVNTLQEKIHAQVFSRQEIPEFCSILLDGLTVGDRHTYGFFVYRQSSVDYYSIVTFEGSQMVNGCILSCKRQSTSWKP